MHPCLQMDYLVKDGTCTYSPFVQGYIQLTRWFQGNHGLGKKEGCSIINTPYITHNWTDTSKHLSTQTNKA